GDREVRMDGSLAPSEESQPEVGPASADDVGAGGVDGGPSVGAERSDRPWLRAAVVVGGAAITVAGAVVATLAATHKTAVFENAKAYANGMSDALEAVQNGFDPSIY